MEFKEIKQLLEEFGVKSYMENIEDCTLEWFKKNNDGHNCYGEEIELLSKIGNGEIVHEKGGYEGEGEEVIRVIFLKDHNIYFKIGGFYSSYNGTDWESTISQVTPKEKTITVFEKA